MTIADGSFRVNAMTRVAEVTDGLSNTAFGSESLLGSGGDNTIPNTPGAYSPNSTDILFLNAKWQGTSTATINPANCLAATSLSTEPMSSWVDGTYTYGLYDHHYTPNSTFFDCISVLHDTRGNNLALSMGWKGGAEPAPWRRQRPFRRRLGPLHEELDRQQHLGSDRDRAGGEVYSSQF